MEEVARWLQQQVDRERRILFLEDALMGGRFPAYAFYRLRFFFLRFLTGCVTHALRFVLILHVAGSEGFAGLLVLHAAVTLAGGFWWGLLEEMRGRIRTLRRTGKPHLIPNVIGRWLTLSVHAAVAVSAGGVVWFTVHTLGRGTSPSPLDVYALAVVLGFGLNIATRCYHSGIYALRRIYRPPAMIVLAEVVSFSAFLSCWPLIGEWSLPLAAGLSSLVVALVTVFYTRRAYSFLGIDPLARFQPRRWRMPGEIGRKEAQGGAFAFAGMQMDSLILLALFVSGRAREQESLFVILFLLAPVVRGALDWARLFYFDLKRLEVRFYRNIRRRFQRSVVALAVALGLGFWVFALGYAGLLGRDLEGLALPLGLFMVSRSLLAAYQIQMFSEKAYRDVVIAGLGLLGGMFLVLLSSGDSMRLVLLGSLNLAAMGFLWWRSRELRSGSWGRAVLWPSEWLAEVAACEVPVRISSGRAVPSSIRDRPRFEDGRGHLPWMTRQIIERVGRRLGRKGRVAAVSPDRFVWFEVSGRRRRTRKSWFLWQGSGLVRWTGSSGVRSDGGRALEAACRRGLLGPLSRIIQGSPEGPVSLEEVIAEFRRRFPAGIVYDPLHPIPGRLEEMDAGERRRILYAAGFYLRMLKPGSFGRGWEVTALGARGELALIFIAGRRASRKTVEGWRRKIREYNVRAAMWGASREGGGNGKKNGAVRAERRVVPIESAASANPSPK